MLSLWNRKFNELPTEEQILKEFRYLKMTNVIIVMTIWAIWALFVFVPMYYKNKPDQQQTIAEQNGEKIELWQLKNEDSRVLLSRINELSRKNNGQDSMFLPGSIAVFLGFLLVFSIPFRALQEIVLKIMLQNRRVLAELEELKKTSTEPQI